MTLVSLKINKRKVGPAIVGVLLAARYYPELKSSVALLRNWAHNL
jgi:hypothetical protein